MSSHAEMNYMDLSRVRIYCLHRDDHLKYLTQQAWKKVRSLNHRLHFNTLRDFILHRDKVQESQATH